MSPKRSRNVSATSAAANTNITADDNNNVAFSLRLALTRKYAPMQNNTTCIPVLAAMWGIDTGGHDQREVAKGTCHIGGFRPLVGKRSPQLCSERGDGMQYVPGLQRVMGTRTMQMPGGRLPMGGRRAVASFLCCLDIVVLQEGPFNRRTEHTPLLTYLMKMI